MQFKIDQASDRPVYQQIIDVVKREIALGRLRAGDKLPTVRELARQLVINPNTIAKSYRYLEQSGVIVTRPGTGAFIAEAKSQLNLSVRKKMVGELLDLASIEAVSLQIDEKVLKELFAKTLDKFKFPKE